MMMTSKLALRAAAAATRSATARNNHALPCGWRGMATANGFLRSVTFDEDTDHYQSSLPRLPVPKLEKTMERYLRSSSAVMSEADMEVTTKIVQEFQEGVGKRLQYELQLDDDAHPDTNYVNGPWFDMYLENRAELPLNLSPQLTWADDPDPAKMDQAARAANILGAAARFHHSLRANVLPPDVFHTKPEVSKHWAVATAMNLVPKSVSFYAAAAAGAYALDMSQYASLFSSTRIPKQGKDVLAVAASDPTFVMVQRGSRFYKVHITDNVTGPLPEEVIEAQLRAVLADGVGTEPPIGVLTALNRDVWAGIRRELDVLNPKQMKDIDSALFSLTLDDEAPETDEELSRLMLHGNGRNRWFDKSFNVIVAANGKAAVNWEHSWGDGVAMLRFIQDVHAEITAEPARTPAAPAGHVERLDMLFSPSLHKHIADAEEATDAFFNSAELAILETEALNKGDLKMQKLSPDGTMQMVLQLAHYRMHGWVASTYESASTAAFKHGRTETIRSATPESAEFCKVFMDPSTSADQRIEALRTAVDRHSVLTRQALMGQGWDRHMFGLRHTAKKRGMETPELFQDKTFQVMSDIRVSTSTLTSPAVSGGGFGPISPRAYSVGYGITDEGSRFAVMTNGLGTNEFADAMGASVVDIHDAIYAASKK